MNRPDRIAFFAAAVIFALAPATFAQRNAAYEEPPLNYSDTTTSNRAEQVEKLWRAGKLNGSDDYGKPALRAFLKAFDVPVESQVLVFSKTSLQYPHIDPKNPRAI